MNQKHFTEEEIDSLKKNPYTLKIDEKRISFTAEFKDFFWQRYQAGDPPKLIFNELGYDTHILGKKRVDGIVKKIRDRAISGVGFSNEIYRSRNKIKSSQAITEPTHQNLAYMQNELLYLRQEVDFIKKIIKPENGNRRRG